MKKNNSILLLDLTQGAMIAALYVVLTFIANLAGLASGVIQVRLSEALTILPVFAIFSLEKLEEVSDFCLILRPVDGSIRNFFLPKLVG